MMKSTLSLLFFMFALFVRAEADLKWKAGCNTVIDGNLITASVDKPENRMSSAFASIDLTPYAGRSLEISIECDGRDVSIPKKSWNGLKVMLPYSDDSGKRIYPNAPTLVGNWTRKRVNLLIDLSDCKNPKDAKLHLGLQESSGSVIFHLDTLTIELCKEPWPMYNQDLKCIYTERYSRKNERLRGVMLPSRPCTEDDFKTLQEWGATLGRYQMIRGWSKTRDNQDIDEYLNWLDGKLDHLEEVLVWAKKYGIKIVVDLHVPPGGKEECKQFVMFSEKKYADCFLECWRRIASRFANRPEIYAFDLINEPIQIDHKAPYDYWNLQRRAAEIVRKYDPETAIMFAPNGGGGPGGFKRLSPIALTNIIYQVHMYEPFQYTHQGVVSPRKKYGEYDPYPGEKYTPASLETALVPVRKFEAKHDARIYAGEFSAIVWAPGAEVYLRDCINLFERYEWDWSYHAFREWNGWSVEHEFGEDGKIRPAADTPRKRALIDGFRKNRR